jgi:PAT family beta-lactamase induction signal transducer AmpG
MVPYNLLGTRWGRLAAFFFLYVTEGIPIGFNATAIATQMRRQGVGPAEIGAFVGSLYLPWAWKWLIGPVVDVLYSDRLGRRRAWIVGAQILMTAALMAAMPVNFSAEIRLFTLIIILHNIFGATQDVAIDALACGTLQEKERGLANGLMFGGAYMGQAVGGSGVLFLVDRGVPFNMTFVFVGASILMVTVFVSLALREPRTEGRPPVEGSRLRAVAARTGTYLRQAFKAFFGSRPAYVGLLFALLPAGAYSLSLALQSNLAVELGLSDSRVGLLALVSTVISALGCVVGGFLSDRFGRKRMLALYLVGTAIPTAVMAWIMIRYQWIMPVDPRMPGRPVPPAGLVSWFWAVNIVYSVFQGLMYGTRTALFMDVCTPAVAATQFTAYMAVLNLVIWYSSLWQGHAIEKWGYPATLFIDAGAGLLCLLFLPLMRGKPPEEVPAAAVPPAA